MIIDHCPRFVQRFFRPIGQHLSRAQYQHLWTMVLAIAVSAAGSRLSALAAMIKGGRHRTRLGRFLRSGPWDAAAFLREQALTILRSMKPRPGETIELLIDDTRVAKRGRQMACLKKIWDTTHQRFVHGHIWVVAAFRFRGVVLPWRIELWKPKRDAGRRYRKTTEIAAAMIDTLELPWPLKVRVLFDAFYLSRPVVRACEHRGFLWFSVAARNRSFKRNGGRRDKLGQLAPGWLKHLGRTVKMARARGVATMRIAKVDGHLSRIGPVRLVASKRPCDRSAKKVVFATNAKMDARSIVSVYEGRWDIEVMFKQLRSDLGLGDYQMLDEQAIVRHLHLCALAHLLLTRHALDGMGAQARKANEKVALPPMSVRRESLRTAIRRAQIHRLVGGRAHRPLRKRLEPYLMAA